MRGAGTDVTTGAFSVGCSGFWIVDGAKAFPVDGVTLGGTTLEILKGIDKLANDIDMRGGMKSPSFRVAEITVGGKNAWLLNKSCMFRISSRVLNILSYGLFCPWSGSLPR